MSKERALLKEVLYVIGEYTEDAQERTEILIAEIEKLLAQPEQEHVGIVRTIGGYPDNSERVVDLVCKYKDLKDGDRLYLAPPKREPLSAERDLLVSCLDEFQYHKVPCSDLIRTIRWILNEPEHIVDVTDMVEQEPVAWMYEWHEGDTESTSTYCGSEKPFQEDEVKPFNLRPLYEHPKRNGLTPREALTDGEEFSIYIKGYARAEIDLKREPLSDESVCQILLKKEWRGFVELVRIIEKAHGIGGGE